MTRNNLRININEDCWKGYKQIGMKKKGNRQVPNCVPIDELQENYPNDLDSFDIDNKGNYEINENQLRKIIRAELISLLNEGSIDDDFIEQDVAELYRTMKEKYSIISNLTEDEYMEFGWELEDATGDFGEYIQGYFVNHRIPEESTFTRGVLKWFSMNRGYEIRTNLNLVKNIISEL